MKIKQEIHNNRNNSNNNKQAKKEKMVHLYLINVNKKKKNQYIYFKIEAQPDWAREALLARNENTISSTARKAKGHRCAKSTCNRLKARVKIIKIILAKIPNKNAKNTRPATRPRAPVQSAIKNASNIRRARRKLKYFTKNANSREMICFYSVTHFSFVAIIN